ncbi:hypothetical protein [uncultured Pseudokineococcus sp.]|uniref:hypothetical protein n=1 Tax=uncultured Pseudokineococcus sp. TaxID=1642928 RepID=UPI002617B182|nr:hypothetical protein [uncultured Pseudokineococcus sp.]
MRTSTVSMSIAAALGLTLAVAAPASADHLAGVASFDKPQECYIGELASGTGEHVHGRLVSSKRYADGQPKSFRCQIRDFPELVDAETNPYGIGFTLSKRGYRSDGIICVAEQGLDNIGIGSLRVNGNGKGFLECTFQPVDRA